MDSGFSIGERSESGRCWEKKARNISPVSQEKNGNKTHEGSAIVCRVDAYLDVYFYIGGLELRQRHVV